MTVLTGPEVAGYWEGAGGPKSRAVEWLAIAIGESSLDTSAYSSAGAIGLWQIMPFNAAPYGYSVAQLYDPAVNASIAVQMSGGGTNCAAWDSCYANIYASGRYSFLAWPEVGSADYNNLPEAASMIAGGVITQTVPPPYPGVSDGLAAAVADLDSISAVRYPVMSRDVSAVIIAADHMYTKGWRP